MQNAETVLGVLRGSLESPVPRNGHAGFGGRPHGKGPAERQAPRRAVDPTYSFGAWAAAAGSGAALLWRAPTQLGLPVVKILPDGTYLSVLINPKIRAVARRDQIMAAATEGQDLDPEEAHLVRVVEYDVPDRTGSGTGELIVLLSTITDPHDAWADELADSYHQRWEQESANDQIKTHLRGPGKVLRSRLPDLVHQEIWAWMIVHYAIAVLISRAAEAADIDPDRISFTKTLRLVRRTATGTADFPPSGLGPGHPQRPG